ncbi:MAG: amidohydrolase family protein [Candidatus Latescibacterota bacterium]
MITLLIPLFTFRLASASDQIPGAAQKQPIALIGGTVHPVSGPVIEKGTVLFDKGKIVALGTDVPIPGNALKVDVSGKHVYPGLIEANSDLGLREISSVRGTVDNAELGTINPSLRSETAVNPDSEHIPSTRSNGIALAATFPGGGIVSGLAAVIMLDGWTWEQMTLKAPAGLVVNWPSSRENREALEKTFREARAYRTAKEAQPGKDTPALKTDLRWEAMLAVLRGEVPVWVQTGGVRNIEAAVEWADREGVKMVLFGGNDADRVADLLRRKNIPVVITPVLRLPSRADDAFDTPFTLADKLRRAGVRFCIAGGEERNLPYHAALAAAYGLPKDDALKSVTRYAAEILGVGDRVGSLDQGKDATLIVTTGDPLEITTQTERMYIQGREVDLSDKHKMLYEKYQEKYRQKSE